MGARLFQTKGKACVKAQARRGRARMRWWHVQAGGWPEDEENGVIR